MEPAQSLNQKHHLKQAPSLKLKMLKERFVIALQTPRFLSEILILPLRLQLNQPPPPWMEVAKLNRLQSCQPALKVLLPTTRPRRRLASPPQKLINLAPSKPVAPTKAWREPCRDDESDDEVCVVGSFSCPSVAEGTSTSCKASRKEVLEAELRGLRQQLEAKRMEAAKKDLPGHGF